MNWQAQKDAVMVQLDQVAELADQIGNAAISRQLRRETIPRVREECFYVVIVGEFNHGKTTLLNALVGSALLPTGVTPTTSIVHAVSHGEQPRVTVVRRQGGVTELPAEALSRLSAGTAALSDVEGISVIEVRTAASFLQSGFVLVDTPGVNDLNDQRSEVVYQHIPRADAIVVVLDAGQVAKKSELEFLRQKVSPELESRLWFLMNKADILSDTERVEALQYARSRLSEIVERPRLFPVSALSALNGNGEDSGVPAFRKELVAALEPDRGRAILEGGISAGLGAQALVSASLNAQQEAMALDQEELTRRLSILEQRTSQNLSATEAKIEEFQERLGALQGRIRGALDRFHEQFSVSLQEEIGRAKAEDLRRYLPGFMEENLRAVATEQAEETVLRLKAMAEEATAFLQAEQRAQLNELKDLIGPARAELDLSVNTFAFDVGVFAVGAVGLAVMAVSNVMVGGALTLAAPILAVVFRGRADQLMKEQAKGEVPDAVRAATDAIATSLSDQINRFGERLIETLERAREGMLDTLRTVVQQVVEARKTGSEAVAKLEARNQEVRASLEQAEAALNELRHELWETPASDEVSEP